MESMLHEDEAVVIQAVVETFGRLDILVNNAGIYSCSAALEVSEELWDKTHATNLRGMFFYSQAAAQEMIKEGHGGKIDNMARGHAPHGKDDSLRCLEERGNHAYQEPRTGVGSTQHTGQCCGSRGIETSGTRPLVGDLRGNPKAMRFLKAHVPLGRMGKPDEIARVVLCFVSAAADYMTGVLIPVEGGALLA